MLRTCNRYEQNVKGGPVNRALKSSNKEAAIRRRTRAELQSDLKKSRSRELVAKRKLERLRKRFDKLKTRTELERDELVKKLDQA